ncbi:MAG: OmpA family protein [Deltaproteobacteria bacterium]|nr:OmpA family protein [Deltaproteobacteria bacterium]
MRTLEPDPCNPSILLVALIFAVLTTCGCGVAADEPVAGAPSERAQSALDGDGGADGGTEPQDVALALDGGCTVIVVAEDGGATRPIVPASDDQELSGSGCSSAGGRSSVPFELLLLAGTWTLLRRRRAASTLALVLGVLALGARAEAASTSTAGFALDRFEAAERGSHWFAADDLDLQGELRPTLGFTADFADAPLVIRSLKTGATEPLVASQLTTQLGASFVLADRVRFGLTMPVVLDSQVGAGSLGGYPYAPASGVAPGDMRVAADVRLLGRANGPLALALGARLYAATGSTAAFASDGRSRAGLRAAVAGALGHFHYALALEGVARPSDPTATVPLGSGANLAAAVGWQSAGGRVRIGPELIAALDRSASALVPSAPGASAEALLGAHVQVGPVLLGLGAGPGLSQGVGTPRWRGLVSFDWSPPPEQKRSIDTDGDGIVDARDACPEVAGEPDPNPARNGCPHPPPDRDGDGIPDAQDACPDQPGPATTDAARNGCPVPPADRDHDGIPDAEDACPDVSGLVSGDPARNGCPPPDRDGDGVPDAQDECPDTPGNPELGGCPGSDRDGDGVPDRLDNCPAEAGPASNQGCPESQPQIVAITRQRLVMRSSITFAGSSARLESQSEAVLDQVARVLKNHPEIVAVTVEGHADVHPLADANLKLSVARAQAVIHYLAAHGVAHGRLQARGYGSTQPLVDRDGSAEAQAQNSRIELRFFAVMR